MTKKKKLEDDENVDVEAAVEDGAIADGPVDPKFLRGAFALEPMRSLVLAVPLQIVPKMAPVIYKDAADLGQQTAVNGRNFQRILEIGAQVRGTYPQAWANAHNGDPTTGTEFVRRWAIELRAHGIFAGVNGKRGGNDLSQDVLDFPVQSGGAQDTSGHYPGILIADVIAGAGGGNASLTFADVSQYAPGKFIDPWLESSETGGSSGGGGGSTTPPTQPPTTPPTTPTQPPPQSFTISREEWEAVMQKIGQISKDTAALREDHFNDHLPNGRPSTFAHLDDIKRMVGGVERDPRFLHGWDEDAWQAEHKG